MKRGRKPIMENREILKTMYARAYKKSDLEIMKDFKMLCVSKGLKMNDAFLMIMENAIKKGKI